MNKRAMVFIDGFNLYYGLKSYGNKYKWLNIQDLAQSFITRADTKLIGVTLFTALIKDGTKERYRQKIYLDALRATCNQLDIQFGHFLYKDKRCRQCGSVTPVPEEKKTDVNIACSMLKGAYEDEYNIAFLVSGDSDLVPPVHIVKSLGKQVIVAHPPKRKSDELCKTANGWFAIGEQKLRKNQLPLRVGAFTKPKEWCK